MNFSPKQHLKLGNYIKYIDEILHKCDKGIEYCKICPNEFVCSELEKDDFGLENTGISDVLAAIRYTLNKIPGYLNPDKRKELKEHIKRYINECPIQERGIWEDSILDILLDEKLANLLYKPKTGAGLVRTLLTYNSKISFSVCLKCICLKNEYIPPDSTPILHCDVTSNSTKIINKFIEDKHMNVDLQFTMDCIKYYLEKSIIEIIPYSNISDIGLAAGLCYYSALTKLIVPENIVVAGGLDSQGNVLQITSLDDKIETALRELHFVEKIIIPRGPSLSISIPENVKTIEVGTFEQMISIIF